MVVNVGKASGRAILNISGVVQKTLRRGEAYVVVTDVITPELVPLLANAVGIVADEVLSAEAAGITRELGVPCIASAKYSSRRIHDGDWVEMDADAGAVAWSPSGTQCILCATHRALRVMETKHFFVIYDAYPVREGHLLVIPVRHVERLRELNESEFGDMHAAIMQVDEFLRLRHKAEGYNIGVNDGVAAGQTVMHMHFHVVPRARGDVLDPRGGVRNFLPNPLTKYP